MSGDDDSSGWQLTESDPGVFRYVRYRLLKSLLANIDNIYSELLQSLGVPLVVDDLYSLDEGALETLQPLRALIFLFKWLPGAGEPEATGGTYDNEFPGFFAHQTVNNACATLAVINALGNIPDLTQGPQLQELLSFCTGMDPQTRGMVVTSADWLREGRVCL